MKLKGERDMKGLMKSFSQINIESLKVLLVELCTDHSIISSFDYGKAPIRLTDSKSTSRKQNCAIQSLATCARIQKGVTLIPS